MDTSYVIEVPTKGDKQLVGLICVGVQVNGNRSVEIGSLRNFEIVIHPQVKRSYVKLNSIVDLSIRARFPSYCGKYGKLPDFYFQFNKPEEPPLLKLGNFLPVSLSSDVLAFFFNNAKFREEFLTGHFQTGGIFMNLSKLFEMELTITGLANVSYSLGKSPVLTDVELDGVCNVGLFALDLVENQ